MEAFSALDFNAMFDLIVNQMVAGGMLPVQNSGERWQRRGFEMWSYALTWCQNSGERWHPFIQFLLKFSGLLSFQCLGLQRLWSFKIKELGAPCCLTSDFSTIASALWIWSVFRMYVFQAHVKRRFDGE